MNQHMYIAKYMLIHKIFLTNNFLLISFQEYILLTYNNK